MTDCKDCRAAGLENRRPVVRAGRCATHDREVRKARKAAAHERRVQSTYGLQPGDYDRLYEAQGGRCAICGVGRGKSKKLAVDHDHETGEVRGLLDTNCNRAIGLYRDDPETFLKFARYLIDPPARKVLQRE